MESGAYMERGVKKGRDKVDQVQMEQSKEKQKNLT